ncbi:leucine-rich repeat domain-containing protein [Maribacter ulvicola]|nr:hypothetical protein [Maribacter ulvicola]
MLNYKHLIYSVIIFLMMCSCSNEQVDIPDINFKNALLYSNCIDTNGDGKGDSDADTNNDNQIQLSEIKNLEFLDVSSKNIISLQGIDNFTKLKYLDCYKNELVHLDVTKNTNLEVLFCFDNKLIQLDVSKNTNLIELGCRGNKLTSLDLSQNKKLRIVYCYKNNLTTLNVKNGNNANMSTMWAFDNPHLFSIAVNDKNTDFPLCDREDYSGWCKDVIASYSTETSLR